jgi:hypothetical protein
MEFITARYGCVVPIDSRVWRGMDEKLKSWLTKTSVSVAQAWTNRTPTSIPLVAVPQRNRYTEENPNMDSMNDIYAMVFTPYS